MAGTSSEFSVVSVCQETKHEKFTKKNVYTKQMGAEGLGRKLPLTPSSDPPRTPEKQTVGTLPASQNMLTLQALSSSLHAGAAKGGCLGRGEAFGCPLAVCPQNGRVHLHTKEFGEIWSNIREISKNSGNFRSATFLA